MNPAKGYYSLIQYCPDLGRLEAANVGVLLFCPERHFLKALTSKNNARIIHFFGSQGHDWERINSFKEGLIERITIESAAIQNIEQLERFIAQRGNLLQITPPRPMKITDPEKDLEELFKEFLGPTVRQTSTRPFKRLLSEKLAAAGLERKIRRDIRVSVPVLQKEVDIPFGFQNGRFNLISPVHFEAANPDQIVTRACKYAVEGRSLHESPHPQLGPLKLIVVGKFRPKDHDSPARVRRIFDDNKVELYRTSELGQLIDEIRQTGKDIEAEGRR